MSYGAAQHGLGAHGERPADQLPNLTAAVAHDVSDPKNPLVILRLANAGVAVEFKMRAEQAPDFIMQVAPAVIDAAQKALAVAGPKLVTPGAVGRLVIPTPGGLPRPKADMP